MYYIANLGFLKETFGPRLPLASAAPAWTALVV